MNLSSVGAGLFDGKIKTSDGIEHDIWAVVTATGTPAQNETEIKGDDEIKATFVSGIREDLSITANGIDFDTIQAITGNSLVSDANGVEVALGTESQSNPPFVEVQAFTRAKDADDIAVTLKKTWHKVQIKSVQISQELETEFNIEMTGSAIQTDSDIEGVAIATKRVATLEVIYP